MPESFGNTSANFASIFELPVELKLAPVLRGMDMGVDAGVVGVFRLSGLFLSASAVLKAQLPVPKPLINEVLFVNSWSALR